jgi:tetratricopeptide (TPR) repeat protein
MVLLAALAGPSWAQGVPANQAPPRTEAGESSSKDTKVDLAPPAGEAGLDLGGASADVRELKPWDPHKADKDVEVGDYYLKRKNYAAAINRYRDALYWKSDDAVATLRLAQALEQVGRYAEARNNYEAYLKILPHGEFAKQATAALSRLQEKTDDPQKSAGLPEM